jgi:hypothetical protein
LLASPYWAGQPSLARESTQESVVAQEVSVSATDTTAAAVRRMVVPRAGIESRD